MNTETKRKAVSKLLRRRAGWLFGFVCGLATLTSLYFAVHQRTPELLWTVTSQVPILDVSQPLNDVQVFVGGDDIAQANLNIKVIRLRLANIGDADVLQTSYDRSVPFGFRVQPGRLLEPPRIVGASSDYLRSVVTPRVQASNIVTLTAPILDRGAYLDLEIRVLHPRHSDPVVIPLGKVAGIDQIRVDDASSASREVSFGARAFGGTAGIQVVRLLAYSLGGLIILISLIGGVGGFFDDRGRQRRKRVATPVIDALFDDPKQRDRLAHLYACSGTEGLQGALAYLEHRKRGNHTLPAPIGPVILAQLTELVAYGVAEFEPSPEFLSALRKLIRALGGDPDDVPYELRALANYSPHDEETVLRYLAESSRDDEETTAT